MSQLFKDSVIEPISLSGANHADDSIVGRLVVEAQFDPLTNPTYRLYYRHDETAAAQGNTLALFGTEGYLTAGGVMAFANDPDTSETPYLHFLLTTDAGVAVVGGANDRILFSAYRSNPDQAVA